MSQEPEDLLESADEAPVIRLVNSLLQEAIKERASDVHIEPFEKEIRVRFRVDGILPYFRYLNFGLSAILVFIGAKMITSDIYHMPTIFSLGAVGGILTVTILASAVAKRREDARNAPAELVG